MGFDIVSIGSAAVDFFVHPKDAQIETHEGHADVCYHIGEKVLIEDLCVSTGGGGTNSAVAFSRLGFKAGWLGVLGDDHNAALISCDLEKEKVAILGSTKKGMSGLSVIMVGLRKDRAIMAYKGINDSLTVLPDFKAEWLYCSSMMGASWKTLVRAVNKQRSNGRHWAFNPSMYLARKGLRALLPVIKGCDLLICNKEEAAALIGASEPDIKPMLVHLGERCKNVVITDGPRGAMGYDGKRIYRVDPRPIKVVETTGAGDAFASGVVAALMLGKGLNEGLRYGMSEAESVIGAVGAKNNLLDRKRLVAGAGRYIVRGV